MMRGRPSVVLALVVVLSLLSLAAGRAAAEDVADEAQFHFARGNQLYRQGRFDEALSELYASNRLVPNRNVRFNIARCLEQLKLYDEAFRSWSELARTPGPQAETTAIAAAIDKLRPHLALVQVRTEPPGADIYAGRRDLGSLGTTPKLLALPPGAVKLILDRPGYRPVEVAVEMVKGTERAVAPVLERIYGAIAFRNLPPGTSVRDGAADGPFVSTGPATRILPGRHILFVAAPGYVVARVEVDVPPDGTATVDVPLAPLPSPTGAIVVRANIEGALVRIDGREMGFSPTVIEGVLEGARTVEVEHEGRETFRTRVDVQRGQRAYLEVELRREQPRVEAASKHLTSAEDAPASISIVTAEQIRALGYLTLSEALRAVRGTISTNDRTYEALGFRGLSPPGDYTKRVLVLIDGHPFNDVVAGQGYVGHDLDVDLDLVERIEVVRGAGSVLYGTGALFGVINVVTRRAAVGVHAEGAGKVGTLESHAERLTASARGATAELLASGAGFDTAGERHFVWSNGSVASLADGEKTRHADLSGRVGPLTLRAGFNDRTKTIPTGVFATRPDPGTTYRDQRAWAELRLDVPIATAHLSARLSYDYGLFQGHYLQMVPPDTRDDFKSQWVTAELRLEPPALGHHHLTVGGEAQDQFQIRQRSFEDGGADYFQNDTKELVASGYAVDDWAPSRRLRVNLGLRVDSYTKSFGSTLNPRLAVIGRPYARGNTKLLLGRAFRAPSVYERFYNDGGATQVAAGPLDPETIVSGELEHMHAVNDDLQIVVAAFAQQLSNMVVLQPTPTDPDVFVFQNLTDPVRGFGGEGEVRWEPGGGTFISFAYTWSRTRQYTALGPQALPNAPTSVAALRVIYPLAGAALRIGNEAVVDVGRAMIDGDIAPDSLLWNVTLSGEAYFARGFRLRYFTGVFNLLDDRAGYPVGAEVASGLTVARQMRTARLGLALAF
jgi:outer membrane receptor for ferrienterochelin and colicins